MGVFSLHSISCPWYIMEKKKRTNFGIGFDTFNIMCQWGLWLFCSIIIIIIILFYFFCLFTFNFLHKEGKKNLRNWTWDLQLHIRLQSRSWRNHTAWWYMHYVNYVGFIVLTGNAIDWTYLHKLLVSSDQNPSSDCSYGSHQGLHSVGASVSVITCTCTPLIWIWNNLVSFLPSLNNYHLYLLAVQVLLLIWACGDYGTGSTAGS